MVYDPGLKHLDEKETDEDQENQTPHQNKPVAWILFDENCFEAMPNPFENTAEGCRRDALSWLGSNELHRV